MSPNMVRSGLACHGNADIWSSPETAERVYTHLVANLGPDGTAALSARGIGRSLHIGENTAKRGLRRLLDHQRIAVVRRGTGGAYRSRYRVLDTATARAAA